MENKVQQLEKRIAELERLVATLDKQQIKIVGETGDGTDIPITFNGLRRKITTDAP